MAGWLRFRAEADSEDEASAGKAVLKTFRGCLHLTVLSANYKIPAPAKRSKRLRNTQKCFHLGSLRTHQENDLANIVLVKIRWSGSILTSMLHFLSDATSPPSHERPIKPISSIATWPNISICRTHAQTSLLSCSNLELQGSSTLVNLLKLSKVAIEYSNNLGQLSGQSVYEGKIKNRRACLQDHQACCSYLNSKMHH